MNVFICSIFTPVPLGIIIIKKQKKGCGAIAAIAAIAEQEN